MTDAEQASRLKAVLARAADDLGMDVKVEAQDTDSRDVPTVILMHDGRVTYSIEVPRLRDSVYTLRKGGGHGPNVWSADLGIAHTANEAVEKLLTKRFQDRVRGAVTSAVRWWDRIQAKGAHHVDSR